MLILKFKIATNLFSVILSFLESVVGALPILPLWTLLTVIGTERFRRQGQINIGLHLSRCRVAFRPAMSSATRIGPSVSRYLKISFGRRGPSPQAFTLFGGG